MKMNDIDVGLRIKEIRKALKMTQNEFAESLQINRVTVGNWEIGKAHCPNRSLVQISAMFNVSMDWLTKGKGEMFVESAESIVEDVMRDNPQFGDIERSIVRNWLRIPHDERLRILDTISKVFDINSDDDT